MYHLYVDESGHTSYLASNRSTQRYLSLTGVIIAESDQAALQKEFDHFRARLVGHTPDRPIILHRVDLNSHKGLGKILSTNGNRAEFERAFAELITKAPLTVINVTIDKIAFYYEHERWVGEPYEFCAFNMIERFCLFLHHNGERGTVTAESRNPNDNDKFKAAFNSFCESGSRFITPERVRHMLGHNPVVTPKKNDDVMGCQIADFLCQPLFEACLRKYRGQGNTTPFHKELMRAAWPKLYRGKHNKLGGCGLVWRPKVKRPA